MKKILILSNNSEYTYNFRNELISSLIKKEYKVYICCDFTKKIDLLKNLGAELFKTQFTDRTMNPFKNLYLFIRYYFIIGKIKPNYILTFTTKPNTLGCICASIYNLQYFPTVTGLGQILGSQNLLRYIMVYLYKISFKKAKTVVFQNNNDKEFMLLNKISIKKSITVKGSGVNTDFYSYIDYPKELNNNFLFIGRAIEQKGILLFLKAAKFISENYSNVFFNVVGESKGYILKILNEYNLKGYIKYHGAKTNVIKYYAKSSCIINPTYYPEGISNVILEAQSIGRPVITSDIVGCNDIIKENLNGFLFKKNNLEDLIKKIILFITLPEEEKIKMGKIGRELVVLNFNRIQVVNSYLNLIDEL